MPSGRPITENVKENKNYMIDYYYSHKKIIKCDCGVHIDKSSMNRHLMTKKHINTMEYLNNINLGK